MSTPLLPKPVWFLPATRGLLGLSAISLGHVIVSPWEPLERLNDRKPPVISDSLMRESPDECDWSWSSSMQKSLGGGILATFLQLLGFEAGVKGAIDQEHSISYTADKLSTEEFVPDKQYLEELIQDPGVQSAFTASRPASKVFLVTGLKKVYGATRAIESSRDRVSDVNSKLHSPALGEVVSEVHSSSKVGQRLSSGKADFIFGLKLRAVIYKNGQVSSMNYRIGAFYGRNDFGDDEVIDSKDFDLEDLTVMSVSEEDFSMQGQDVEFEEDGLMKTIRLFHPEEAFLRQQ